MKIIKNKIGVETLVFAETFEPEAYAQIEELANFEPYLEAKIRVMPDAHAGKGCTVGTTMTISDKVTPNLVGVDIGCGMLTIQVDAPKIDFERLDEVINKYVPTGFNVHEKPQAEFDFSTLRCAKHVGLDRAALSLGSLGGGNHFVEIGQHSETDCYYLIIHTGSRKLGGDVCKYYQDKAFDKSKELIAAKADLVKKLKAEGREKDIQMELKKLQAPPINKDLAFLSGQDFDDYMNDMAIVQKFASINRSTIADIILKETFLYELDRFETIHNYIDIDNMILRKGAVSAEFGELLLIPINMKDGSLLCVGKGNPDWNYSAPHGAGRLMSRTKAKETLSMSDFKDCMKHVYTTSVGEKTLDEAPQAYKNIEEIKAAIVDTVDIVGTLETVYNFKAHE